MQCTYSPFLHKNKSRPQIPATNPFLTQGRPSPSKIPRLFQPLPRSQVWWNLDLKPALRILSIATEAHPVRTQSISHINQPAMFRQLQARPCCRQCPSTGIQNYVSHLVEVGRNVHHPFHRKLFCSGQDGLSQTVRQPLYSRFFGEHAEYCSPHFYFMAVLYQKSHGCRCLSDGGSPPMTLWTAQI